MGNKNSISSTETREFNIINVESATINQNGYMIIPNLEGFYMILDSRNPNFNDLFNELRKNGKYRIDYVNVENEFPDNGCQSFTGAKIVSVHELKSHTFIDKLVNTSGTNPDKPMAFFRNVKTMNGRYTNFRINKKNGHLPQLDQLYLFVVQYDTHDSYVVTDFTPYPLAQ